jgi:NADH-quinone oxidoreductase subunit G
MADAATNERTVTVNIDGRPVSAAPGEMLIAAAERAGTYIPRFCYHPRMKSVGVCRMCLVEVKGPRGFSLQPACFVPVSEGQEVLTTTQAVKRAQDGVLELLLVNHPLDCPVCDKGGECPLQDQTISFGPGESRFVEEKRHFEKPIAISSLVYLDRERCIQCSRCTRFAAEVAGDPLIDFLDRGEGLQVNTFPDEPFSSYFSGNTVQICPVGALTAKPYRFRARPWDLEQVESTCTTCSVGCRVAVQSSANRITRYLGIDSDPVNQSWLCDRGRFDFEALNSDQRMTDPLISFDGELMAVSWAEALKAAANGLAEAKRLHGAESIAVIGGARLADEDAYAWAWLAKGVLGTDSVDSQLGDGLPAELVIGLPRATVDEACQADLVVLAGPDLKEELPVLYLRLRQAATEHGLKILELAPMVTGASRWATTSLVYRPGEIAALASALVAEAPPAGGVAGVDVAALQSARALLSGAQKVVVVLGRPSLAESAEPIAAAAAVLAGQVPGVGFLPVLRRGNVNGAIDMGLAPGLLPGRVSLEAGRDWFTKAWGGAPAGRGLDTAGILEAAADGRIHGLVLLGADPIADFPDRQLAERAIERAGFVVAVDTFLSDSSWKADVVLPAAGYAERGGTTTNIEGRVSRLGQKCVPPGVAWPDWIIAVELAHRLGVDLDVADLDDLRRRIEALAPSRAGVTSELLASSQSRDGVVTPGAGAPAGDAPAMVTMSDVLGALVPGGSGPQVPAVDAYSLRLIASRRLYDLAAGTQLSPSLAALATEGRLHANAYDLDRLGVTTGDQIKVSSARGSLVAEVAADAAVARGTAWMAFNAPGPAAASLIDVAGVVTDIRLETP